MTKTLTMVRKKVKHFLELRRRVCGKFVITHLRFLKRVLGTSPINFTYWVICQTVLKFVFQKSDALLPSYGSVRGFGIVLSIPDLKDLLANDLCGEWALDSETIELLWSVLWRDHPQLIVECGSGISTLVLAKYAALASSDDVNKCFVISVEQDWNLKTHIENRLRIEGLSQFAEVLYAPLNDRNTHDFNSLKQLLISQKKLVDWLLIDGPSGASGCRLDTLPALSKFCHTDARWFLHDAFRDAELKILQQWRNLPTITVEGIYPIGEGLAIGYFRRPLSAVLAESQSNHQGDNS